MNGRTHVAVGTACAVTAASVFMPEASSVTVLVMGTAASAMASILPDCDLYDKNMKAAAQSLIHLAVFCFAAVFLLQMKVDWMFFSIYTLAVFAGIFTPHRAATHSVAALFGYTYIFYRLLSCDSMMTLWFFAGYASHLVIDLFNKRGEMLLWPIIRERYCLRWFRAVGKVNRMLFCAGSIWYFLVLAAAVYRLYIGGKLI